MKKISNFKYINLENKKYENTKAAENTNMESWTLTSGHQQPKSTELLEQPTIYKTKQNWVFDTHPWPPEPRFYMKNEKKYEKNLYRRKYEKKYENTNKKNAVFDTHPWPPEPPPMLKNVKYENTIIKINDFKNEKHLKPSHSPVATRAPPSNTGTGNSPTKQPQDTNPRRMRLLMAAPRPPRRGRWGHDPPTAANCCDINPFFLTVLTFAVRETASLGIMGAPRVPPLNTSETIVLSEHYRL